MHDWVCLCVTESVLYLDFRNPPRLQAEEVDPTVLATLDDEDVFDDQGVSEVRYLSSFPTIGSEYIALATLPPPIIFSPQCQGPPFPQRPLRHGRGPLFGRSLNFFLGEKGTKGGWWLPQMKGRSHHNPTSNPGKTRPRLSPNLPLR